MRGLSILTRIRGGHRGRRRPSPGSVRRVSTHEPVGFSAMTIHSQMRPRSIGTHHSHPRALAYGRHRHRAGRDAGGLRLVRGGGSRGCAEPTTRASVERPRLSCTCRLPGGGERGGGSQRNRRGLLAWWDELPNGGRGVGGKEICSGATTMDDRAKRHLHETAVRENIYLERKRGRRSRGGVRGHRNRAPGSLSPGLAMGNAKNDSKFSASREVLGVVPGFLSRLGPVKPIQSLLPGVSSPVPRCLSWVGARNLGIL